MYFIYSLLTAVGMLLLSPYFIIRGLIRGKNVRNIPERLGWKYPPKLLEDSKAKEDSIWIHAVSVGEVLAVVPLAKVLKQRYPDRRLVVSTTTETGQRLAEERMQFADAIFYFPLDWAGPVRRALKAAGASVVIIVETEIWPNFLRECRRASVPVVFVNGRLSERSFRGFQRGISYSLGLLRSFLRKILNDAALYLMQSDGDANRIRALGAPEGRVIVTGNLKYDLADPSANEFSLWLEKELGERACRPVLVAGSVLANEESQVLEAFAAVQREFPDALLILAPRKPEQFDKAAAIVSQAGHAIVRRSDILLNGSGQSSNLESTSVLVLDSLGELGGVYRLADVVFVGGSLIPKGGHNILEPAAFGKVPLHGPSMENFREMSATFLEAGASISVGSGKELGAAWCELLRDPARAAQMGNAARELIDRNRGATARALTHIEGILNGLPDSQKYAGGAR